MRKEDFINQFEVVFLANFAALNYEDYVQSGNADKLIENLPYEDARELAKDAWRLRNEYE